MWGSPRSQVTCFIQRLALATTTERQAYPGQGNTLDKAKGEKKTEGEMCTHACWRPEGPGKAEGRLHEQ